MPIAAASQSDRIKIMFDGTTSPVKTNIDPPEARIETTNGSLEVYSPSETGLRIETCPPASIRVYDLQAGGGPIAEGMGAVSLELTARDLANDRILELRMMFSGNSALVPHTQVLYINKKPYPKGITPLGPGSGPGVL